MKKTHLNEITKETFQEAIALCLINGLTSFAPLGASGESILLFGEECGGRESVVSIRNYNGNPELLITDKAGQFLFYGTFRCNLGVDFIAEYYWNIFNFLRDKIEIVVPRREVMQ